MATETLTQPAPSEVQEAQAANPIAAELGRQALATETEIKVPGVDPKLVMKDTDPATIDRQVEEGVSREGLFRFLNNFEHHLPGGWDDRNLAKYPELLPLSRWEDPFDDEDDEDFIQREVHPNATDFALHSDRCINGTNADMRNDVRTAITGIENFDADKLEELRVAFEKARDASPSMDAPDERTQYLTYALPVYKALRQMGYSHYDLWV